jgi:hypothetical protein
MRTQSMSPSWDNKLIWIVEINLDSSYWYFSDTQDKITLNGTDFDGKVIFKDSFSELENQCNIVNGGSFGQVGNFTFSLARWNNYTGIKNFFNDLYPQTSKPLLTAKTVRIGYLWYNGSNTLADITWEATYYIQDYSFPNDSELKIVCYAKDELSAKQIPPYVVQKDFDNGISYFLDAPDESYGKILPIIYGDFSTLNLDYETFSLAPAIQISKGNYYKVCSHICKEVSAGGYLYEYLDAVQTVMELSASSPVTTNNRSGHAIYLVGRAESVKGRLKLIPRGYITGGTDYQNAIDKDSDSYATLAVSDTIKWALSARLSDSQFGLFNGIRTDCNFIVKWDASGGNVNASVAYWHLEFGVYSSLVATVSSAGSGNTINYYFGDGNYDFASNQAKRDDVAHWTPNELEALELHISNLGTSSGTMQLKHCYFDFQNLTKYWMDKKTTVGRTSNVGQRGFYERRERPQIENFIEDNVYTAVKGYMVDIWSGLGTRTSGIATDDLIEVPALIIESLIRDEICVERDLVIDSISTADIVFSTLTPLNNTINDFYNTSILVNVTRNERYFVSDYVGATRTLTLDTTPSGWSANDKCYLKNVDCHIDITSFDAIQKRQIDNGWEFARVLNQQQDSQAILNQLLFESFCMIVKSNNEYKLIDLATGSNAGTLEEPIWENGSPLFSTELTPFNNIYTDFTLNYGYDYAKKIYSKRIFVNKNGSSNAYLTTAGLETYCSNAEIDYKIKRKYEYNADWVQDDDTANFVLESMVKWLTYQRMVVSGGYDCEPYLQFETGDRMLIDFDFMIPTVKNDSQEFIIMSKNIDPIKKKIQFNLVY